MATLVIGHGGHGRDIASWSGGECVRHHTSPMIDDDCEIVVGINDPHIREHVADELHDRKVAAPLVHPSAVIGTRCHLSPGVVVGPLSSLVTEVYIGGHAHVGAGCHLTRCIVGAFATIGPGATICGDVMIGNRVMIGAGATVKNLVQIGDDVTIGAGAVVVNDVPDGATVKGVPAR
jgi:acetyltransferase-like isoleucine patch superfamily enzyme